MIGGRQGKVPAEATGSKVNRTATKRTRIGEWTPSFVARNLRRTMNMRRVVKRNVR